MHKMRIVWHILIGVVIGVVVAMSFQREHGASMLGPAHSPTSVVERELDRVVPSIDIQEMPFDGAVAEIQKLTPSQIVVDWKSLGDAGFNRKTPVSIHGTGIQLWQVLDRLTAIGSRASREDYYICYQPREGRIAITTANARLHRNVTSRLYDVHDLVSGEPQRVRGSFGRTGPMVATNIEQLSRLIVDTVASDSWYDSGGTVGSIYEMAHDLYIVQEWSSHRKIQDLLRDLRAIDATPPLLGTEKTWSDLQQTWISPDVPAKMEALLRRPIDRVDLDGVPFGQAIDSLEKKTGVIIAVNWNGLAGTKMTRESPVSVRTRDVPLPAVLDLLFARPFNGVHVGFSVYDGIVEISNAEETAAAVLTRIYDIRDLVEKAAPSKQEDIVEKLRSSNQRGAEADSPSEREELLEKLCRFINDTVAPDSWRDSGGTVGSIREFKSRLIITQTWVNHERIAAELNAIRKSGRGFMPATQPSVPLR